MKHPLGEIISLRVNKPFSYQEIQRIKEDLGDYLEDPEKYIRAFKGVTMLYDLTWKDVMYILGQMLTPKSKTRVLGKLPCIVRILRQSIWKLVTELHLAVLRNKKGGDVGGQSEALACGKGHEDGGLTYTKAELSLRSSPGNPQASTPITRACLLC